MKGEKIKKYEDYSLEDFLGDEFFLKWAKSPTQETEEFWLDWSELNPEKVPVITSAKNIINTAHYKKQDHLEQKEVLAMYEQIIKGKNQTKQRQILPERNFWQKPLQVAAAILLLITAGMMVYQVNEYSNSVTNIEDGLWQTSSNPAGRKSTLKLVDGTTIKLNAGSSLTYPKSFDGNTRKVILNGEAFFEVTKNPEKPFIIETGDVQTKVLGTSFNIKSEQLYNKVQVAVVTGLVEVKDKTGNNIQLKPHEAVTYHSETKAIEKYQITNLEEIIAWKNGVLYFQKSDFQDVCKRLEIWYGVKINIEEGFKTPGPYSGEFENQSLSNVLKGISFTSGFHYKIVDKTVFITNNK